MVSKQITEGERKVFKAYVDQESLALAAQSLSISEQTLKNHLGSIYKKVGAKKAHSALYRMALNAGHDPLAPPNGTNPGPIRADFSLTDGPKGTNLDQNPAEATGDPE